MPRAEVLEAREVRPQMLVRVPGLKYAVRVASVNKIDSDKLRIEFYAERARNFNQSEKIKIVGYA